MAPPGRLRPPLAARLLRRLATDPPLNERHYESVVAGRHVWIAHRELAWGTHTVVGTSLAVPIELSLEVRRWRLHGISQALRIKDDGFEDTFIVKSNDDHYAHAWLAHGELRRLMLAAWAFGFAVAERDVEAHRVASRDLEFNDELSGTYAAEAVAALAARGELILDDWRALGALLGGRVRTTGNEWRPDGNAAIEVDVRGTPITVDTFRAPLGGRRPRLLTRIAAPRADAAGDAFFLCRRDGKVRPPGRLRELPDLAAADFRAYVQDPTFGRRITRRVSEFLAAARPDAVTSMGEDVTLLLSGLVLDAARLRAAVELAEALATFADAPSGVGPYR